jgi:predicted DNA-binding protein (MmcQ/YjbR family)
MNLDEYNSFCASLPHTSHVIQWGRAHVWKVGGPSGKVFAIGGWDDGSELFVTFKCSPISFELLKDQPGCRPAPYLASRGMPWIQRYENASLDDAGLEAYLTESHRLAGLNLPKKLRLGL